LHAYTGAHFYLADHLAAVTAQIAADLSSPAQ
jgi:surfactin synthase thioesterase subunit